jgi:Protein phosphatase 2C
MEENWGCKDEDYDEKYCLDVRREYFCCLDLKMYWYSRKKDCNPSEKENLNESKKVSLVYYSEATDHGNKPVLKTLKKYMVQELTTLLCFDVMRADTMIIESLKSIIVKGQNVIKKKYKSIKSVHISLNILIIINNKVFAANIGANRLFFIERTKYKKFFESKFITVYHTKENIVELFRVKREQSGIQENKKLRTIQDDITESGIKYTLPAYDITRAVGVNKLSGISSEPDIRMVNLEFKHLAIFFGSQGL